jgi:hypothetical protein
VSGLKQEKTGMTASGSQKSKSPSQLIDARIKELGDWRGKMLSRLRALVKEADPEAVEEWKWRGVPVCASGEDVDGTGTRACPSSALLSAAVG